MALTQDQRFLSLKTPFSENELVLTAFHGQEFVSRLFSFQLEMLSDNNNVPGNRIVGKDVTFGVKLSDDSERYFHGFVNQFVAGDEDTTGRREYRAEVVPWLWFLTQTSDCRIFQNKTVPDIIEQIFKDLGFSDYESGEIKGEHKEWEYCVQYRETDFNFVSRLMEQEGIFYYFRHEDGKHVMVLADQKGAYKNCAEKEVEFPREWGSQAVADHITSWEHRYQFHSGKWAQTDYNFEKPSMGLMTQTSTTTDLPGIKKYEIYDYPGEYLEKDVGSGETRIRMEEEEVEYDVVEASSLCKSFTCGGKFTITKHRSSSEEGKTYVITSLNHTANESTGYESGAATGDEYTNYFTCIPAAVTFRPFRNTPKPLVSGVQTAVVVGPKGEEIYCDQYGRVKVQFYWDREGKHDENSSIWMRTAHNIAGKQWGFLAIPRIGQEVVVDFLEGDPDRPLIVGSVYNGEQVPHYNLPDEKTKTYIKTNTSKGGEGFNELMFEDKKDDERVFLHAQKNMDFRVLNDSKSRIYGNRHQIVGWEKDGEKGGDQREMVYEDKHQNVKRHQFEHIEGNYQLMVGNGEADDGGNLDIVVEKKKTQLVEGDSDLIIKGDHKEKIDGTVSETIGGDHHTKVGGNIAQEAGAMGEIHIKAGMKVIIEAGQQLSLVGPGGFVDIGPSGVTIQGMLVNINSGGAAGSGSGCKAEEPEEAVKAEPAEPQLAHNSATGYKSSKD